MFKYFTNILLQQYFVTRVPLKVFVQGEYLKIVDVDDLDDNMYGYGMKMNGEMEPFDYREIEQIMVGKNVFTLDKINKALGDKTSKDSKSGGSEKDSGDKAEKSKGEEGEAEGEEGAKNPFA